MSQRTWLLVFIFLMVQQVSVGQVIPDTLDYRKAYLDHLGIEDGLSQGMINDLVIDQDGFLWIATKEGLNRYDGKQFKVFRHDPKDPHSISDNLVTSLFVDSKNNLWIGTDLNGLNLLNRENESFIHFSISSSERQKLSSNSIGDIFEDPKGNIIIQAKAGKGFEVLMPGSSGKKQDYSVHSILKIYPGLEKIMEQDCCFNPLYFTSDNTIWYQGFNSIYRIQNPTSEKAIYESFSKSYTTTDLYMGNLFLFDQQKEEAYILSNSEIEKFDRTTGQFIPYLKLPKIKGVNYDLFIDNNSRLWITFRNNKWWCIDLSKKEITIVRAKAEGFNDRGFCCTFFKYHDQQDNLWIGTGGFGLLKWSSLAQKFISSNDASHLGPVYSFRVISPGSKAAYNKSIVNKWKTIYDKTILNFGQQASSDFANTNIGKNGEFYFHLKNDKKDSSFLVQIDSSDYKISILEKKAIQNDAWHFAPLFLDKENKLWYSERSQSDSIRLFNYLTQSDSVITYTFPVEPKESIYRFILDWHETKAGNLWLGTTQGLFYFNPEQNKWKRYHYEAGNDSSLSLNMVLSVCPDPENPEKYLWAGTNGGGLNKLNIETGNFTTYKKAQGLPNDVIYGIQSDHKNNLWISTNRGLSHFNTSSNSFTNYNTNHGLAGNEFNRYEFSKSDDGTLYFGGVNGVVSFHPKDFYTDSYHSNAIINQFKLLNTSLDFKDTLTFENERFFLKKPIEQLEKLELSYNHRMFSFGFSVLDLTAQKSNKIKYKLEGFHNDWIEADISHEATFTSLDPGNYTLKVLGYNSNHQWSEEPTTLQLSILPPWWGTWWFRVFVVLLFAGALYTAYRYRLSHVLKMERLRNQIAQDLHDDIGSTLSSISVYSAAIQKSAQQLPEKAEHILGKIIEGTTETMERMNDMVWAIKADNDYFNKVILRMYALAVDITEVQGIQLQFNADKASEDLEMNMLVRKNIYLIYKEALNNAIKYAQCDIIEINVQTVDGKLHIEIRDNGSGFDTTKNKYNMGGNGLSGMHKRAEEIGATLKISSKIDSGTSVRLIY